MLDYLTKYPLQTYREAEWFFASGWPLTALSVLVVLVALVLAAGLLASDLALPKKICLWFLQMVTAVTLLSMLWQPSLRVEDVQSGENAVSLMLDSSLSMSLVDASDSASTQTRLQRVTNEIDRTDLIEDLSARYQTEILSFSTDSDVITDVNGLTANGQTTALQENLDKVLSTARQRPLAGVVVFSDGVDNVESSTVDLGGGRASANAGGSGALSDVEAGLWGVGETTFWDRLAASGIPVFAVATGSKRIRDDLELTALTLADQVSSGAKLPLKVVITHDAAARATLKIYDGEELLLVDRIDLPEPGENSTGNQYVHTTSVVAPESGIMDLRFELDSNIKEPNRLNNRQRRIVKVQESSKRVLYLEGEPRWEYKFIRRALLAYPGIELVSLLRTSPNKFYRQGVRSAAELQNGFPETRQELYSYDAVIIGSLEAAHLNAEQQRHLVDFVRVRGGSLMMLGGKSGLGDGGWARSEVAQALPAVLDQSAGSFSRERRQVQLTRLGEQAAWLQFGADPVDNRQAWSDLPELADFQTLKDTKPGAAVLLTAATAGRDETAEPLLMWQRYGRGKSYVLATSGTWRWQMGLPAADQRHERFWQGLAGHLVSGVLPRMTLQLDRDIYFDQQTVNLAVTLKTEQFTDAQNVPLQGRLIAPDGQSSEVNLLADRDQPGRYITTVEASQVGEYELQVIADEGAADIDTAVSSDTDAGSQDDRSLSQSVWFVREDGRAENFGVRRNDNFMRRLANESGGQFLELEDLSGLSDMLRTSNALLVREQTLPLWNMPAAFVLLFLAKMFEWALRWRWNRI